MMVMYKRVCLFFALLVMVACYAVSAFANLLITPLQVVIEGRDRSAQVVLINNSDEEKTYRIFWEQFIQRPGRGGYYTIDDPEVPEEIRNATHLKDFAVYTPRQITLQPREKQTVRIAVRRSAELEEAEYKSHLKFQIVDNRGAVTYKDPSLNEDEFRVGARVNASFSVPVVYRVGEYDIDVSMGMPSFSINENTGRLLVHVPVQRRGKHGVIGFIQAYYAPDGGEEELIGSLGNANMFPEIDGREFIIPTKETGLLPGQLRLVFYKNEGTVDDRVVLDQVLVPISN